MGLPPRRLLQVDYSAVREAAEAQAGRLEFVRQATTVSLAGLAGVGILLFTESSERLSGLAMKYAVGAAGAVFALTLVASMHAMTTYANYIRVLGGETGAVPALPGAEPAADYEASIGKHLRWLYYLLILAGGTILLIGLLRVFAPERNADQAMERGRQLVSLQTGIQPEALQLTTLQTTDTEYAITYTSTQADALYFVRLDRRTLGAQSFARITVPRGLPATGDNSTSQGAKDELNAIAVATAALANTVKDIDGHVLNAAAVTRCYAAVILAELEKGTAVGWSEADLSEEQRRQIQRSLVSRGLLKPARGNRDPVDGVFGPQTRAAFVAYHRQRGVRPALNALTRQDVTDLGVQLTGGVSSEPPARLDCDSQRIVGAPQ